MDIKKFLFVDENDDKKDVPKETPKATKFPSTPVQEEQPTSVFNFGFGKTPTPVAHPKIPSGGMSPEHLEKALKIYQDGFDSANQPGYDFYEFYQAITSAGTDSPQLYPMAFAMAKSMEKSLSKESLLQQSEFYISEILKAYNNYIASGNSKRDKLIAEKGNENQSLSGELELLRQQMESIKIQIEDRSKKLAAIDSKYQPMISEVDSKLAANDEAKNQIIQLIEKVKQGIINNLK